MLSCVIPVYRAAPVLAELTRRLIEVLSTAVESFEILYVEDCGGDSSWETIVSLAAADPRVHGLRMSRNYGQHNAILCGIREARGAIVVTMDDDLQHPPEELPKLLAKLAQGFDVVYGPPSEEKHEPLRNLASIITKFVLQEAMGAETARQTCALRVFRTELRNAFADYRSSYVNIDVLLSWATTKFAAVRVRHDPRTQGESGYTTKALIRHAFNMVTGFSATPLQAASLLGFAFAVFGFVLMGYIVIRKLVEGSSVPGFSFLASIIAIFSGVQLFSLGIIGEYLARMHFRAMDRPVYSVRQRTTVEESA
jgi:glycosyltransferase involved in cell wall biosynthesis